MSEQIKAIETVYKGLRFRSRLEARWAVFFDTADIRYEYEPEGFELPDGTRYLPDFYLPEYDWYVEVKPPRNGAGEDLKRASRFIGEKIKVLLLLGNIPPKKDIELWHYYALYFNALRNEVLAERCCFDVGLAADQEPYTRLEISTWLGVDRKEVKNIYMVCQWPEKVLTAIHDREISGEFPFCETFADDEERIEMLAKPYEKARQARFEYGEMGQA